MQFEAKTYKNQSKGFAEVTGNFHNKDSILSWLIPKKKNIPKQNIFFKTHFKPISHVYTPWKHQKN